jgi:hypothetical protein
MTRPLSMEEFGPIALDYFNGQRVEDVIVNENPGDGEPVWSIKFEGGGLVHNYDPTIDPPKTIKDAALTLTVLGGHDTVDDKKVSVTELRFGLESVKLNPLEYAMVDGIYTKGQIVYVQRSKADMPGYDLAADMEEDAPSP